MFMLSICTKVFDSDISPRKKSIPGANFFVTVLIEKKCFKIKK